MTGQRRPTGWAVLVGVLCAVILVGLSLARGTASMTGVAHSERGPSSASVGTSTAVASLSSDPDPSAIALPGSSPRGSSRGAVGLAAAPPVPVPATPAVAAPSEGEPQAVVVGVVRQGAFCAAKVAGQTGYTSGGTTMICSYGDGDDRLRWRAVGPEQEEPTDEPEPSERPEPTAAEPSTGTPASTARFESGTSTQQQAPS
jgi:hypothetical protein